MVGERLRVWPGEAIPVDGIVLSGRSAVDESTLTGTALAAKAQNVSVTGGTIADMGSLEIEARAVVADTMLSRMIKMEDACPNRRAQKE